MCILEKLFFLLFFLPLIYADYCQTSLCGNNISVRFPFQLEGKQRQNCSYPGFNLGCGEGITVLKLPLFGEFFVRNIDYLTQQIYLYDRDKCLPRRLQSLNLSGSPFVASLYHNYTFLSCPAQLTKSQFTPIGCLSNSTTSVFAISSNSLEDWMIQSCQNFLSVEVPVSWPVQFNEGFSTDLNNDLQLAWSEPDCKDCESRGGICGFKSSTSQEIICFNNSTSGGSNDGFQVFRILCFSIALPAIICTIVFGIYLCFMERRRGSGANPPNFAPASVTPQPTLVMMGLDESTIESYQKLVLGESKRLPGPNDGTCPICLSEYCSKDTIRCIPECKHCFHADCIDEWLRLNSTCPVCRNSPSHAHAT